MERCLISRNAIIKLRDSGFALSYSNKFESKEEKLAPLIKAIPRIYENFNVSVIITFRSHYTLYIFRFGKSLLFRTSIIYHCQKNTRNDMRQNKTGNKLAVNHLQK